MAAAAGLLILAVAGAGLLLWLNLREASRAGRLWRRGRDDEGPGA